MSEFGGLTVSRSKDFKGDLAAIRDALNGIGVWDGDGEKFQIVETAFGPHIAFSVRNARMPTVFPENWEKMEAEEEAAELENREPVFAEDVNIPLEKICKLVSPLIDLGEISIACVRYEGNYWVNFERLTVCEDGSGERATVEFNPVGSEETLEVI